MRRFLLALFVFTAIILFLRRLAGLLAPSARRRDPEPRYRSTELVRDRVCDTFLPRDRALTVSDANGVRYFCSDTCRDRHLTGAARGSDAA